MQCREPRLPAADRDDRACSALLSLHRAPLLASASAPLPQLPLPRPPDTCRPPAPSMLRSAEGAMAALARGAAGAWVPGLSAALRAGAAAAASGRLPVCTSPSLHNRYTVSSGSMTMDDDVLRTAPPRYGSTVVLVSGGIESAALLSYWKHWDHAQNILPLFVDYGQRNARQEEEAQQAMCRHLGLEFNAINASMVAHQLNMATSGKRYHDPLPHRNLLLFSLAASFAADSQASSIAICLTKDDLGNYSSATMPFLRHIEALFETLNPPVQLLMPLVGLRKEQVLAMGEQVGAPWHLTYSCAEGGRTPCGKCSSCTAREEAFDSAGLKDPLLEAGGAQRQGGGQA